MRFQSFLSIAALSLCAACASTGATFRSGVGPTSLDHPPFYAGAPAIATQRAVTHLAIRYQRGAEQAARFEPAGGSGTPVGKLVAEMNHYLDSLRMSVPVVAAPETGTAPDTHFSCTTDMGDCVTGSIRRLQLSVGRPSQDWIAWLTSALDSTRADDALVITLELGQYLPRRKGFGLDKEVELGTGYAVPIPRLTSLENPLAVVQLTGALVGRDGRAIRIGAEGMIAKRTNIVLSSMGVQSLISDEDLERLRTLRREDLPGQPLVWQAALRTLVAQLTGRGTDVAP